VFDLDDTLYDEITYVKSGFMEVAKVYMPENPHVMFEKMIEILERDGRGKVFDNALKHFGFTSKKDVKKALGIYRSHMPKICLNEDAREILSHYKNTPLYIVTDGNKLVQERKVKALGLEKFVKKAFITHRYGTIHAKPSPYCFEKIALLEGVKNEEIVYIADNVNKDFIGIKKLGFQSVRISQGMFKEVQKPAEYHANVTIDSLKELKKLLKVTL
jgi:putative hydrolase of the HAD superfamily